MHPDISSTKPGKCSKCGMDMKEKATVVYSCPMKCEGDKTYDKPGKCPKCGMDLTKSKNDEMKMEMMKSYCCPMHPEIKSNKPGKCSRCGMDLKEKEKTSQSYVCPMHPEVTSDKPGQCSKCGMDLVKSKNKPKAKKD